MENATKFTITAIGSAIVGSVITTFILLTEPFSTAPPVQPGGITIEEAYIHSSKHTGGIQGWRGNTSGIWYSSETIKRYLHNIDSITATTDHKPPSGYSWEIGIYYGKGTKNGKNKLMTMFVPVLVNNNDPSIVIDVFVAKKYHDESNSTEPIPGGSITYFALYEKYYKKFETKRLSGECTDCIAYDSGSMFP